MIFSLASSLRATRWPDIEAPTTDQARADEVVDRHPEASTVDLQYMACPLKWSGPGLWPSVYETFWAV